PHELERVVVVREPNAGRAAALARRVDERGQAAEVVQRLAPALGHGRQGDVAQPDRPRVRELVVERTFQPLEPDVAAGRPQPELVEQPLQLAGGQTPVAGELDPLVAKRGDLPQRPKVVRCRLGAQRVELERDPRSSHVLSLHAPESYAPRGTGAAGSTAPSANWPPP